MRHMVIDLETFDTRESALVLSLGAVVLDTADLSNLQHGWHWGLTHGDQEAKGRTISAATVKWWMRQDREAQEPVVNGPWQNTESVLREFAARYTEFECGAIWGYGADFDCGILASLYDSFGIRRPWSFRDARCLRTLKNTFPSLPYSDRSGVIHNALTDAIKQAEWLRTILLLKTSPDDHL